MLERVRRRLDQRDAGVGRLADEHVALQHLPSTAHEPAGVTTPHQVRHDTTRYNTTRDAILTCAQKPTWASLIYRTESINQSRVLYSGLK